MKSAIYWLLMQVVNAAILPFLILILSISRIYFFHAPLVFHFGGLLSGAPITVAYFRALFRLKINFFHFYEKN